jgi:hypothetical protein
MRNRHYTQVDWKKYLIPKNNFVKRFLDENGDAVFNQIYLNIDNALNDNKTSLAFVVHTNAHSIVIIEKKDFIDVLNECTKWFVAKENYEKCLDIEKIKNKYFAKNLKKPRRKKELKLI